MKKLTALLLLIVATYSYGQKKPLATDAFVIEGAVQTPVTISLSAIDSLPAVSIGQVIITNHAGVVKDTLTHVKGVLLKTLLQQAVLSEQNPKLLSEYYFVCKASDNYKVVFSWNELFNTATGDHVYIVTEKNNQFFRTMNDRITLLSPTDTFTGRRFLKGLSNIIVQRVP
jgi:hypothetical protein